MGKSGHCGGLHHWCRAYIIIDVGYVCVTKELQVHFLMCYFIMLHATLILYYHESMLTIQKFVISCALWLPHVWYNGV